MPRTRNVSDSEPKKVDGAIRKIVGVPSQSERLLSDELDCDACGSPMTLEKEVRAGHVGRKKKWRVRKFECACGFKITVHGNGSRDMCEDET
jgi:hypothetical protein